MEKKDKQFDDARALLSQVHPIIEEFTIGKDTFLFRPLTIRELSLPSQSSLGQFELEQYYLSTVHLYPTDIDWDKKKAGDVLKYIDHILSTSGFDDLGTVNRMLEKHRAASENNIIASMKSYIITAMPAYKESDLVDLSMDEFVRLVVLAEEIITIQQTMSGLETTGFKLIIAPVGQEEYDDEEEYEDEAPVKTRKQKVKPQRSNKSLSAEEKEAMKKQYIARIRKNNAEIHDVTSNPVDFDTTWLESLDVDALQVIAGVTKEEDPVARALAQSEALRKSGR